MEKSSTHLNKVSPRRQKSDLVSDIYHFYRIHGISIRPVPFYTEKDNQNVHEFHITRITEQTSKRDNFWRI